MAFWGVEVKAGSTYTHPSSKTCGRLRLSQATLGFGESAKKSFVQCNVGDKSPVLLCSLYPGKCDNCHLELEFDEADEVVFSVIGPRSVHLTGYYLTSKQTHHGFGDSSESYGEDVGNSDSCRSYDRSDEDEYDDSFINDDDVEVCPTSPAFSTEEMEEIMDDKESNEKKGYRPHGRIKMFQISDSEDDGSISQQGVANDYAAVKLIKIEDEDNTPISSLARRGKNRKRKLEKDQVAKLAAEKSNEANVVVEADPKSVTMPATLEDVQQTEEELKAAANNNICIDVIEVDDDETKEKWQEPTNDKKLLGADEKKSKRKRRKSINANEDMANVGKQAMEVKTFSNGLVVEELELGNPDGQVASFGKKVKIHYTGKIKEGGHVYETSIGSNPYKFRIGKGKTIEGLQLGLEGMRTGGRRRLTIPPQLGYGAEGIVDSVPPNSSLELDIQLLRVR